MLESNGTNRKFIYSEDIDESIKHANMLISAAKSRPDNFLDLRNRHQKIDDLINESKTEKLEKVNFSKPTAQIKEVIVLDLSFLEEKLYIALVDNFNLEYDINYKTETKHHRFDFIVELYKRYVLSEAYWSEYHRCAFLVSAMDDIYKSLLSNMFGVEILDLEPYINIMVDIDEMLYFNIPSKLRESTWDIWEPVKVGRGCIHFVNTGDFRIHYFANNALHDKNNPMYGIHAAEVLYKDV